MKATLNFVLTISILAPIAGFAADLPSQFSQAETQSQEKKIWSNFGTAIQNVYGFSIDVTSLGDYQSRIESSQTCGVDTYIREGCYPVKVIALYAANAKVTCRGWYNKGKDSSDMVWETDPHALLPSFADAGVKCLTK